MKSLGSLYAWFTLSYRPNFRLTALLPTTLALVSVG
jgi:hypothetical protein